MIRDILQLGRPRLLIPLFQERNKIMFDLVMLAYGGGQTMSKNARSNVEQGLQAQDGIVYRQM